MAKSPLKFIVLACAGMALATAAHADGFRPVRVVQPAYGLRVVGPEHGFQHVRPMYRTRQFLPYAFGGGTYYPNGWEETVYPTAPCGPTVHVQQTSGTARVYSIVRGGC